MLCVACHIEQRFLRDQGLRLKTVHPVRHRNSRANKGQKRLEKLVLINEFHRTCRQYSFGEVDTRINRDTRHKRARPLLQNIAREIESVGIGQVDVHQDKARAMRFGTLQSGGTVRRFNDWKAGKRVLDARANRLAHWHVIIDDQNRWLTPDTS